MSVNVAAAFESRLQSAWPLDRWRDLTVVAAVSGGADSVALLRSLASLHRRDRSEGRLIVAHFNHRLRGAASDADAAFVQSLADELNLQCVVGHAKSDLATNASDGLEAAARQARYDFFIKTAAEYGARYVATAHTADDQVETVLFNILRGTGLAGLAGIPRTRPLTEVATLIRPLLDFKRADVVTYLASLNQAYRDDETNQLTDYTRNRLRHELLPKLERDYNLRVREALLRLSQAASQADDFLSQQAEAILGVAARRIAGGVELELKRLAHLHPALIRHTLMLIWQEQKWPLQDMSFEKWELLATVCQQTSHNTSDLSVQILPGGVRMESTAESLRLTRS